MFDNPLIERYRCSIMRPMYIAVYMAIYVLSVVLLLYINYAIYLNQDVYRSVSDMMASMYWQFLFFQSFLLWVFASYNAGNAITTEVTERSYDFFKLLPMSAHEKAVGIMLGRNLVVFLLAAINFVFLLLFGLAGEVSIVLQIQIGIFLAALTLMICCMSLLSSTQNTTRVKAKNTKNSSMLFAIFAFYGMMVMVGAVREMQRSENVGRFDISFYWMDIPGLLMMAAVSLYLAAWAYKGILRGLIRENEPLFTSDGALCFQLGYIIIITGFFAKYLLTEDFIIYTYWAVTLLPVLILPFASLKSIDKYIEISRRNEEILKEGGSGGRSFLFHTNLFTVVSLFLFWSFTSAVMSLIHGKLAGDALMMLMVFSFFAVIFLLIEVHVVFARNGGKLQYLIAFLLILYLFVPIIFMPILDMDDLYIYSPVGIVINLFNPNRVETSTCIGVLVANTLLAVFPFMLVMRKYREIMAVRKQM